MAAPAEIIPPLTDELAVLDWTAQMRQQHPVWQGPFGGWHVFRHADVRRVLRDTDAFSSDLSRAVPGMPPRAPGMVTQFDPPEHRKLRGVLSAAFTPRSIAALEPRIREVTGRLLDAAGGEFELVEALARPLPITVIAELLGLPAQDHGLFARWTAALFDMQVGESPSDPALGDTIGAVLAPLSGYLAERCRERRVAPGDDLISRLLTTESEGRVLSEEEATNFAVTLLLAGHITTTALLGNIVRTLDEHPQVWADLHADPARIPSVIEEVMRYRPPFPALQRATVAPVELGGVALPAGAVVTVWILAANRDPDAHTNPDRFDPGRGIGGAAQLTLGHGVHFCLGAPLARLEARAVMEELLGRADRLAVDHDGMVLFDQVILGPRRLPVITHPS
jgi:erythromycin 12 hydroxylase